MYVTLEPCAHQGRQPPCTEAIVESGVRRVVIASEDPTEKAAGRGPGILRDAGVEVAWAEGEVAAAARLLNQPFRKHSRTRAPARRAEDGAVPRRPGRDRPGRLEVDLRRGQPRPRPRVARRERRDRRRHRHGPRRRPAADGARPRRAAEPGARDLRLRGAAAARLAPAADGRRGTGDRRLLARRRRSALRELEGAGAEVLLADGASPAERVVTALDALGRRGITSLFLEGGPTLAAAFLEAGEVDEARIFVAPILIGAGPAAVEGAGVAAVADAARAVSVSSRQVGDDVLIWARMREW